MKKTLLALLVSLALAVPISAAAGSPAANVESETVGGFAVKLAAALGTPTRDQNASVASLRADGIDLDANLSARLTEQEAARILSDLGMKVATSPDPTGEISVAKANQLAAMAGLSTGSGGVGLESDDLPFQCLLEKNHGQCQGCCKLALDFGEDETGSISRFCAKFCRLPPPPPSNPEPQP